MWVKSRLAQQRAPGAAFLKQQLGDSTMIANPLATLFQAGGGEVEEKGKGFKKRKAVEWV